ncbi:MAG: glycosyltransferase family 39 protein [Bacteroidales bacterium]|nr:glycosyltransferase family 39 protein [Bacteroidales bacterium]
MQTYILSVFFLLKLASSVALTWLYTHYYPLASSDIYNYFNDGLQLKKVLLEQPDIFWSILKNEKTEIVKQALEATNYWTYADVDFFFHEKKSIILLNTLFSIFSFDSIYVNALFFSMIGFIAQVFLYRFVSQQFPKHRLRNLLIVFALPTFVLWTSGILKEPILMLFLALSLWFMELKIRRNNRLYYIPLIASVSALFLVKSYVAISFLPALILYGAFKFNRNWTSLFKSRIFYTTLFLEIALVWFSSFTKFDISRKLADKQKQFVELIQQSPKEVGSKIETVRLSGTLIDFAVAPLKGIFNVLTRPNFKDYKTIAYLPDLVQNIGLLVLLMLSVLKPKRLLEEEEPFFILSLLFIFNLFAIVGMVIPVIGAIVRYKIPAFVFLWLSMSHRINLSLPQHWMLKERIFTEIKPKLL